MLTFRLLLLWYTYRFSIAELLFISENITKSKKDNSNNFIGFTTRYLGKKWVIRNSRTNLVRLAWPGFARAHAKARNDFCTASQ